MKVLLALSLLVAATSAAKIHVQQTVEQNHLEDLVTKFLNYAWLVVKQENPYVIPFIPDQQISEQDINFMISASDAKIFEVADFVTNTVTIDPVQLTGTFGMSFPAAHFEGQYSISGSIAGYDVEGSGTFSINVTNFVQNITGAMNVIDHSIQITSMTLDHSMEDFHIDVTGLTIQGMDPGFIDYLLNDGFKFFLQSNKEVVEQHVAAQAITILNNLLIGTTLDDIVHFLENIVG